MEIFFFIYSAKNFENDLDVNNDVKGFENDSNPGRFEAVNEAASNKSTPSKYNPEFVEHTNPPYLLSVYKKERTLEEFIIILVPLVSNVTNVRFIVSTDGTMGYIKYEWPNILFNPNVLFENEIDVQPKILSLHEELMKCRESHMDIPESVITIKFPFAVQTSPTEHIIKGFSEANVGCKIMKIELPAVRKSYAQVENVVAFNN